MIKTVTLNGIETPFAGDPDDPYFQGLEHHAVGLDGLAALVGHHVPRDATVLDVGANIGLSTILLARLTGRVVAFEPSPPNVAFLRRNLELNAIPNVEVVAAAVSDAPGTLRFHVAQFGAGSHVVAAGHVAGQTMPTVDVPAIVLDDQNLPPLAFLKIDAEGHEPNVLAGARALLARDRPLIYTEINVWCLCAFAGHSPGALVRTLWESFEVGTPEPDGHIAPLPDPYAFLHDTIVFHGGLADIALRPRPGAAMPTLPDLAWPVAAVAADRTARAHLAAMAASTSWKVTDPLRRLRRLVGHFF
jgi:FkbM family methyltransferase